MLSQIQLSDTFKSSAIKENDMVNTSITAPGALVALALIYLKSNNRQIADMIKIPHTFEALDSVTPQTTILKVIARNLVLWDSIECTADWVDKQIPELIRFVFYCENERDVIKKYSNRININDIDFLQIALTVANIRAAAVMSIGFRYAGTCNQQAKKLILDVIM